MVRTYSAPIAVALLLASASSYADDITIEPRGRLHLDGGFYSQDQTELGDGLNVRRGRIGIEGTLAEDWSFVLEYDIAEGGEADATDVYLRTNIGGGKLTIGHQNIPYTLSNLTSSNNIPFMERSTTTTATGVGRKLGVRYDMTLEDLTSQTMLFGRSMNDESNAGMDETYGLAQRLVFHPVVDDIQYHLGAAVVYQNLADYNNLRLRDRPEIRIDEDVRLINTGTMTDINSVMRNGLEFAVRSGPFSAEAEYNQVKTSSDVNADASFSGYHVQASYVLTGESRGYSGAGFKGVKPATEAGAWEVALRYSVMDLNDGLINGGEQNNITVGVNYYLTSKIRFMGNIVFIDVETPGLMKEDPTAIGFRMQYSF